MPIDPSIALNVRPIQFESPLNQLAQAMQIKNLQQQGELGGLQIEQTRGGIERANALRQLLGGFSPETTPEQQAASLTRGGFLPEAQTVTKTAAEAAKLKRESEKSQLDNLLTKINIGGQILGSVKDEQSYQSARQLAQQEGFDPWPESYNPAWIQQQVQQGLSLKDRAEQEWRKRQDETTRRGQDITAINAAANVAAQREQASATRDAAKIKADRDTEMKLADDYRTQSKNFKEVADAYGQISKTIDKATTSPAATLAAATKFMKLLDPGSVVRESELGMALAASGVIDRAFNYYNVLASGKVLTKQQAADFKNITSQIYQAAQESQKAIDADFSQKASTYGLRPEMVIQNLGQNKPTGNAPPSNIDALLDKYK